MSSTSIRLGDTCLEDLELFQIETRCRELRQERDMLRESQSESLESIKGLELYVKSLLAGRKEDKKRIKKLEAELWNCFQEIEYVKLQLNDRNEEFRILEEGVRDRELKHAESYVLEATIILLRDELDLVKSECKLLKEELCYKEERLTDTRSAMQKLEESMSSLTLDSQCEIESMKLDMIALEQSCNETKQLLEKAIDENLRMNEQIKLLETQLHDSEDSRQKMEKETKELKRELDSDGDSNAFVKKINKWLENQQSLLDVESSSTIWDNTSTSINKSTCKVDIGQLFSKLTSLLTPALLMKQQLDSMAHQVRDYEAVVQKLKDELRAEKLKAKEEAEDLAQEMAELRYETTLMVEQECKLRACIENASLQRIARLEAELQNQHKIT